MRTFINSDEKSNKGIFKKSIFPTIFIILGIIATVVGFMEINTFVGVIALIITIIGSIMIFASVYKSQGAIVGSYVLDEEKNILYNISPAYKNQAKGAKYFLRPHAVTAMENIKKYQEDGDKLKNPDLLEKIISAYQVDKNTIKSIQENEKIDFVINEMHSPEVVDVQPENFVVSFVNHKNKQKTKEISNNFTDLKKSLKSR